MSIVMRTYRPWENKRYYGPVRRILGAAIDVTRHGFSSMVVKVFTILSIISGPGLMVIFTPLITLFGAPKISIDMYKMMSFTITSSAFSVMPQLFMASFMGYVISDDFKENAIHLYLSRPVYRVEYILSRMIGGWIAMMLILGIPLGIGYVVFIFATNLPSSVIWDAIVYSIKLFAAANVTLILFLEICTIVSIIAPKYKPTVISFAVLLSLNLLGFFLALAFNNDNYRLINPFFLTSYGFLGSVDGLIKNLFGNITVDPLYCLSISGFLVVGLFIIAMILSWKVSELWAK